MADNKKIAGEFYARVINERNPDIIAMYITEDFIHNGEKRGVDGQKAAVMMFLNAFDPLVNTIEFSFGEADLVCVHETWEGTHSGSFMGVAPTGKKVQWKSTAVLQFREGKICRAWDENDFLGLFTQIGSFPKI